MIGLDGSSENLLKAFVGAKTKHDKDIPIVVELQL